MSDEDQFEALIRGTDRPLYAESPPPTRRRQRRGQRNRDGSRSAGPWILTVTFVLIAGLIGGGVWGWSVYGERVLDYLGEEEIADYEGDGVAPEILLVIEPDDIGEDVARKLAELGVTESFEAVYSILLQDSTITFFPGTYRLLTEMSGRAAIDALQNPDNRVIYKVTLPEGVPLSTALEIIADNTDIPLVDLQEAVEDPTIYGVNPPINSLEGYLFPATYTIEPSSEAVDVITTIVQTMLGRLETLGVAPDQWHEVLTKASLIEREAGVEEDFYKVARVIENRLADDMALQFDSTVTYWEESYGTVWTTDEARANADNPYNTYYYKGLPAGPIGAPGDTALDAVLNPAEGDWRFFVTVNLQSGATVFSATLDEHNAAVGVLLEWCDRPENSTYCD